MISCIDAILGLKSLPDNYADICLIDPPYNIGKNFGNSFDRLELQDYIKWAKQWIDESIRILKNTGTIYIYGFSEILAHLFVEVKFYKRWLVWHYTNKNSIKNLFWQRSHESILAIWKDESRIFNIDDIREPYTKGTLKNGGKKRSGTKGRFSARGKSTIYQNHEKGAMPRDVIKVQSLSGGSGIAERFFYCKNCNNIFQLKHRGNHSEHEMIIHPTQKPVELTLKLLKAARPQNNGIIVVPFCGTGSELLAAKQIGMEVIGFDINEDYVNMAKLLVEKGFPGAIIN